MPNFPLKQTYTNKSSSQPTDKGALDSFYQIFNIIRLILGKNCRKMKTRTGAVAKATKCTHKIRRHHKYDTKEQQGKEDAAGSSCSFL